MNSLFKLLININKIIVRFLYTNTDTNKGIIFLVGEIYFYQD